MRAFGPATGRRLACFVRRQVTIGQLAMGGVFVAIFLWMNSEENARNEGTLAHRIRWLLLAVGFLIVGYWSIDSGKIPWYSRRGLSAPDWAPARFGMVPVFYWLFVIWMFGMCIYCVSRAFDKPNDA